MTRSLFYQYLHFPELLDDRSMAELEKILEEYPYFQSARLLHIKNLNNQGSISYDRELKKTAIWVTDRSKLFFLLDKRVLLPIDDFCSIEKESSAEEQMIIDFSALSEVTEFELTDETETQTTDLNDELSQLIMTGSAQASTFFNVDDKIDLDDFKRTFKKKKPTEKEEQPIEPTRDEHRKRLIDSFITEQPKISYNNDNAEGDYQFPIEQKIDNPELITDTLAKIYIKQGKYEKAILAYEKLSLKYPEKNIYFASQIKKIKQLINNQ